MGCSSDNSAENESGHATPGSDSTKNNQSFNLIYPLVILSSQPMSTQTLTATLSGYLLHGSYLVVDLSPQQIDMPI
jgi:hypothetical protein